MDKTYAETMGQPAFDWNLFLDRADAGEIAYEGKEYKVACHLSGSWTSCACGNECAVIPRYDDGSPIDCELWEDGVAFYREIARADWVEARLTLARIESRSAILIAEELAKRGTV